MKCNHCKKIIPNGEEIIKDKEYLHEECLTKLEKEEKEKTLQQEENTKKTYIKVGFGLVAFMMLLAIYALYPFKKKKLDSSDYELAKAFFLMGGVILLAAGALWITGSWILSFAILFLSSLIWLFKVKGN